MIWHSDPGQRLPRLTGERARAGEQLRQLPKGSPVSQTQLNPIVKGSQRLLPI